MLSKKLGDTWWSKIGAKFTIGFFAFVCDPPSSNWLDSVHCTSKQEPLCWGRPIFWPCRFITRFPIMQIMPRVRWLWMPPVWSSPLTLARKSPHNWIIFGQPTNQLRAHNSRQEHRGSLWKATHAHQTEGSNQIPEVKITVRGTMAHSYAASTSASASITIN